VQITAVSHGPIGVVRLTSMSPVSRPMSMNMVVIPVSVAPSMIAWLIGAAPRYLGSSEACTLMQP